MRPSHAAVAVVVLAATAGIIAAAGRSLAPRPDAIAPQYGPAIHHEAVEARPEPQAPSRAIDPEIVAPPSMADGPLERAAPRPPLSELALAQPPKPKEPGALTDEPLFRPVAVAAGLVEAGGRTIALAGIDIVEPDETCTDAAGEAWACGLAARTAFRAFLRGRAIVCTAGQATAGETLTAACSLGKRDIGQWLSENGWARTPETGPYAQAGKAAQKAGKGIYGAAPDLSGLPPPPPVEAGTPDLPSILDLSGTATTPPVDPPTPFR